MNHLVAHLRKPLLFIAAHMLMVWGRNLLSGRSALKTQAASCDRKAEIERDGDVSSSCDACSALQDTAPHVDRHVIVRTTSSAAWPKRIEKEENSFAARLSAAIESAKSETGSTLAVKMTAYEGTEKDTEICQVILYPEGLAFTGIGSEVNMEDFARMLLLQSIPEKFLGAGCSLPWKKLVLVCTHGSRDKRCGRAGPQIITELQSELKKRGVPESEIAVRASSHIGGHKYAGTLIVYPCGEWYGYVSKRVVPELVDSILSGTVLSKCFRGRGNVDW